MKRLRGASFAFAATIMLVGNVIEPTRQPFVSPFSPEASTMWKGVGATTVLAKSADPVIQTDWPVFHFNQARAGENPYESILSPDTVASLTQAWSNPTRTPIILGSPVVAGGMVFQPDGGGDLYAMNATTGGANWSIRLG